MELGWLALAGFRSYPELEWRPDPGVNLLVGPNGAGKTNLVEAVAFLSTLRSLRGVPDEALIHHGHQAAVVRGGVRGREGESVIEVELGRRTGRRALVNGVRPGRHAELVEHLRVVAFLPDDLDLVKRGPAGRRAFLDEVAVQLWPMARADQAEYERALRQRNAFLRRGDDDLVTLGVWDERLAHAGGKVVLRRAGAAHELAPAMVEAYRAVAGSEADLRLEYRSEWGGELDPSIPAPAFSTRLGEALERSRRLDRERRTTTVGPQRDDPALLLDGRDLRFHGSQGEQRTAALALRLATHLLLDRRTGPPVLMLDDVFSELDPDRGAALVKALPPAQTLITTTDPAHVPLEGRRWTVERGTVW